MAEDENLEFLKKEKEEIEKKIGALPEKKNPLELEKMKLEEETKELEKILEPILIKEKETEEKKLEIEKEEKETKTILEKRERERERWQVEEEREKIEKEKWFQLEKIEEFKKKIRKMELKIKEILEEGEELKRKREEIIKKEREIELKKEGAKLGKILKEVPVEKEGLEKEKEKILNEKERLEREFSEILQKEKEIEEEEKSFEEEEQMIEIVEEKKEIESQRAEIEKERKETEIKRWEIEDKKIESEKEIKKLNGDYQKILEKEKTLKRRIKEICEILGLSFEEEIKKIEEKPEIEEVKEEKPEIREEKPEMVKEEEKPETEEKPEIREENPEMVKEEEPEMEEVKEEKPEIREERPEMEEVREEEPEIREEKPEIVKEEEKPEIEEVKEEEPEMEKVEKKVVIFPEEEKLEFLKREEIRTMAKDIKGLREIEAGKEGERVSTLETEKKKAWVMPPTEVKIPSKETVLPKPPKKSSPGEKILVRIGTILIFLSLLAFFYWFFFVKKPLLQEFIEKLVKEIEKTEIAVPLPLIPIPEEKVGQLFIVGFEGKSLTPQLEEFFKKYKPGGLLLLSKNIENENQLKKLISDLQNLSLKETGLPLFIAVDQEGGQISRIGFLEEKTLQSQIKNNEEAFQVGQKRGKELKELGVNLNLAPVLDDMKSGDFYFSRSFQKSPEIVGELSKALILGQKSAEILTAIKHFPGYVGIGFDPKASLAILEKIPEISQFTIAMESKPEFVLSANAIYKEVNPSLPFAFSQEGIQFLKNNLGQDVLIISDDLDQNSLLEKFSLKEILTKPIEAGVDVLIFSGYSLSVEEGLDAFFEAVKNKEISETKLNEKITKIIEFKQELLK